MCNWASNCHARYIAYRRDDTGAIELPGGWSADVYEKADAVSGTPYLIAKLNDPQIDELRHGPGSFRFLANYVPLGQYGAPLTFEEIAGAAQGRALLGYVKADVDYLGTLFAQGLQRDGDGYDTAAHLAALSREFDLFFSGWVQHLLSSTPAYRAFYTIFSGGDDLFLVGPWNQAVPLARAIQAHLHRFTGDNQDVTLSAGVLYTKPRYPIARSAADAEQELEHAKQHRDRITVLGDTLRWDDAPALFEQIARLQERAAFLTSALLYDLVEYGRLYRLVRDGNDEHKAEGLRYKAMFAYNIARNLRKGDAVIYQWADTIIRSMHGDGESLTMQHLGLIATYLLFSRREKVRHEKDV